MKLTIDRIENDQAVLITEDGISIVWPKDKLPKDAKEGSIYEFVILSEEQAAKDKKELAKSILNEILNV